MPTGYHVPMTYTSEQLEAVQNAVDRVGANWDAATEETVEAKLRQALAGVGVDLPEGDVRAVAEAIDANDGRVEVASVLGG